MLFIYPNLFTSDEMEVLCASGEWKLYWKQRVVDSPDFDVLGWWERACNHMGLATLGHVALNALTDPVTTTATDPPPSGNHFLCLLFFACLLPLCASCVHGAPPLEEAAGWDHMQHVAMGETLCTAAQRTPRTGPRFP